MREVGDGDAEVTAVAIGKESPWALPGYYSLGGQVQQSPGFILNVCPDDEGFPAYICCMTRGLTSACRVAQRYQQLDGL